MSSLDPHLNRTPAERPPRLGACQRMAHRFAESGGPVAAGFSSCSLPSSWVPATEAALRSLFFATGLGAYFGGMVGATLEHLDDEHQPPSRRLGTANGE